MDRDAVAEATAALYQRAPEAFIASRDELVKELRRQGEREAAAEVSKLRRPTVAAWVVNLLVSDQPDLPAQLGELAEQLREAEDQLAGEDLRALGRQRHQLVAGLVARARELARGAQRAVNADILGEVESTLRAALADPAVAATVLSGRLAHPVGVEGFGPLSGRVAQPQPHAEAPPRSSSAGRAPSHDAPSVRTPAQQKADERRRAAELRKAEQELEKAEADLAAAEDKHAAAAAAATAAEAARAAADERATWLRTQLQQATAELEQASLGEEAARHKARTTATAVEQARERVDGARARADLI